MKKLLALLIGIFVFCILPFIGWGLYDIDGFIQNPVRLLFVIMMAILSLWVVFFVPDAGAGQKQKNITPRQRMELLFLQIIPLIIVISSPWFDHHSFAIFKDSYFMRYGGLILACMGFLIMNWAVIVLDRQFSVHVTIQDSHKLITRGPYRYVRHPRYLGILLFLCGIALIFRSWIGLLLVLMTLTILLWRIQDEESLMHHEFKQTWEDYKKKTYFLIPFIY